MKNKYTYMSDPGHGWVSVGKAELDVLGISHQISRYSYMKGERAYLEEDADMSLWIAARRKNGFPVPNIVNGKSYDGRHPIRSYAPYACEGQGDAPTFEVYVDGSKRTDYVKVPMEILNSLGIREQMTSESLTDGEHAYLCADDAQKLSSAYLLSRKTVIHMQHASDAHTFKASDYRSL